MRIIQILYSFFRAIIDLVGSVLTILIPENLDLDRSLLVKVVPHFINTYLKMFLFLIIHIHLSKPELQYQKDEAGKKRQHDVCSS